MLETLRVGLEHPFHSPIVIPFVPVNTVINSRYALKRINELLRRRKGTKISLFLLPNNVIDVFLGYFDGGEFEADSGGNI